MGVYFASSSLGPLRKGIGLCSALVVISGSVLTSHAASRLEYRSALMAATWIHHASAGAWIGGLPYLLVTLYSPLQVAEAQRILGRFSKLAMTSVGALLAAAAGLSILYIDLPAGLYGSSYGIMVLGKICLAAGLLAVGGMNYRLARTLTSRGREALSRLRVLIEAEVPLIGLGALVLAASLTPSAPPAIDLLGRPAQPG